MKKGRVTIILFAVLGTLLLLYFIFNDSDEKRYQWYESYRAESDQPYGTLFIRKLLESYQPGGDFFFNDKQPLKNLLKNNRDHSNYVFIGQSLFLDDQDVNALIHFMDEGGDAFIASLDPPQAVLNGIYYKECDAGITFLQDRTETINFNFYHDTLQTKSGFQYAYRYSTEDVPYSWNYFYDGVFCDSTKSLIPLGYQKEDHINFLKIPAGKGNLYLHSNPLVFTNYFLSKQEKVDYVAGVFSHLSGKHILWDEFSKIPFTGNNNAYNSPLYYILQQPSLKYAWWLLLFTVLLYIFFVAKRKQRVIPVFEPKTNTSLEFVNLISTLHYQNANHMDMAKKKMKYFLYFVRSKYGIHAETFTEEQVAKLAEKSKVNIADVRVIFDQYDSIEKKFHSDPNRLSALYYAIDNFYKHCKH